MFWNKPKKPAQDALYPKLPLDLRPGALINIELAETLRFEGLDLSFPLPEGESVTEEVSAMDIFDLKIVRAYTQRDGKRFMFQFNCQPDLSVNDLTLFMLLEEMYPATSDDWEMWLGDGAGLIGGADLNAPNGKSYRRDWGEGSYAAPVEANELLFKDPAAAPRSVAHKMMLYSRDLGETSEYALLSADEESEQALVRAWVGVDLNLFGCKVY
jgi:hypothetical protein